MNKLRILHVASCSGPGTCEFPPRFEILNNSTIELDRFLLAVLHMDALCEQTNLRELMAAANRLPSGIVATYDLAMKRINNQKPTVRKLAKQVLTWVSCGLHPLSLKALQHALATFPGDINFDHRGISLPSRILSSCAGLVTVDVKSGTETHPCVGLLEAYSYTSHDHILTSITDQTVKDYLDENRSTLFPKGDELIARTCLTYLSFDDFAKNISLDQPRADCQYVRHLLADEEYPFLQYAATYWGRHVAKLGNSMSSDSAIGSFLSKDRTLFLCAVALWSSVFDFHRLAQLSLNGNKHHYHHLAFISWLGLMPLLPLYLPDGAPVDRGLEDKCLLLGAKNGQDDVVRFFIDRGADCDGASDSDGPALWNAAIRGYTIVVATLLRHGAGNNARIRHAENRTLSQNHPLQDLMQKAHRRGRSDVERLLRGHIYGMGEPLDSLPGGRSLLMPGPYPLPSPDSPSPIQSLQPVEFTSDVPTPATHLGFIGHMQPQTRSRSRERTPPPDYPGSPSTSHMSRPHTLSNSGKAVPTRLS